MPTHNPQPTTSWCRDGADFDQMHYVPAGCDTVWKLDRLSQSFFTIHAPARGATAVLRTLLEDEYLYRRQQITSILIAHLQISLRLLRRGQLTLL